MVGILKHASRWIAIGVCAPCALAGVLTVGGAGAMYPDLPEAVAAAVDGDVLLVRPGYYSGFTIDAKAIAIVADAGAVVTIGEPSAVRNLAAGQTVLLSGLSLPLPFGASALTLANNAGRVRVERLDAHAANYVFSHSWYAVDIANCADASFVDCDLFGRPGEYGGLGYGHGGEAALHAVSSSVALHDCNLSGGLGLHGFLNPPSGPTAGAPGAAAFEGFDATLIARRLELHRRERWRRLQRRSAAALLQRSLQLPDRRWKRRTRRLHHGCAVGRPPDRVDGRRRRRRHRRNGSLRQSDGAGSERTADLRCGRRDHRAPRTGARALHPRARARRTAARAALQRAAGLPRDAGDRRGGAGWFWLPSLQGVLLVQPPLRRLSLGVIPASGVLDVQLPVPDLGAGVDASLVHAQAVFVDAGGQSLLSSPGVLVLLDSSF